jgi:glycosyltransferase involved in cell wall biosynthesis
MSQPGISIGLPVYNGENYLDAAIESILAQDYSNFELIISDNASEDRTPVICERYRRMDSRVRYVRAPTNRGAAWNYNHVFGLSSAPFFKWQAHDDLCLPAFLSRCLDAFNHAPASTVLVYPCAEIIDADGARDDRFRPESLEALQPAPHQRLATVLRNLNMACPVFGVIRTSALAKTRLIAPFVAADYVLLAELALLGTIHEVPDVLFQRRVHPNISTYANRSAADLLRWYDPAKRASRTLVSPQMALGGEYLRSINRLPLSRRERARCRFTAISVWYERELRNAGGRYKSRLKKAIGLN